MWGQHCIGASVSLPVGFDPVMPVFSHPSQNCSPAAWQVPRFGMVPWGASACSGLGCGGPQGPCPFPFPGEGSWGVVWEMQTGQI